MDVADQFQKIGVFFAYDGFITVLEKVTTSFMTFVECNGVARHEATHDLA